ncbi:MAG: hypothetical protein ABSF28_06730 [Terracidiphilus sp.]|jgi:hypothetical protein
MEISPISGIRALPVLRARPTESELTALSDIEELARIGDETYTPSDGKQASAAEDDEDELTDAPEMEEVEQTETTPIPAGSGKAISYFA